MLVPVPRRNTKPGGHPVPPPQSETPSPPLRLLDRPLLLVDARHRVAVFHEVSAVLLRGVHAESLRVDGREVVRLERILDDDLPVAREVALPRPCERVTAAEPIGTPFIEWAEKFLEARSIFIERDEHKLAAGCDPEARETGVLAVKRPERLGVRDAAGAALGVVLPAVVLALQPRRRAPRHARQAAVAVR